MARRRSGYIQIDVNEILEEVGDDDLLDELHKRKLSPALPGESTDLELVLEAYRELSVGRITEARAILERIAFPKWKSLDKCQKQYAAALAPPVREGEQ